jgi:purine nucleoside phosphorylase
MDVVMGVISKDEVLTDVLASMAADGASTNAVATSAAFEEIAGTASAATGVPEAALAASMGAEVPTVAVLTEEDAGNFSGFSNGKLERLAASTAGRFRCTPRMFGSWRVKVPSQPDGGEG